MSKHTCPHCPTCLSSDTRLARKGEKPKIVFVIKAWRRCNVCGGVFQPPSSLLLCMMVAIGFIAVGVGVIATHILPVVTDLIAQQRVSMGRGLYCSLGCVACFGAVNFVRVCWQIAIYSRRYPPKPAAG